jgi:ABC-2 type transport system permease protein
MNKVGVVVRREFLSTVRRRSYLIVTFGMPLFAAGYFGLVAFLPAYIMATSAAATSAVGLVDLAGVVRLEDEAGIDAGIGDAGEGEEDALGAARALANGLDREGAQGRAVGEALRRAIAPVRFRSFPSRDAALEAMRGGAIERFYILAADYLATGAVETYQTGDFKLASPTGRSERALERLIERSLLRGRVPDEVRARLDRPLRPDRSASFVVTPDGRIEPLDLGSRIARLAIPAVFGFLLLMSLMTSAGYLLQGVAEEKENRVIEVILSSIRPAPLLFGKLIGLGAAGLLQLVVWITLASFATSIVAAAVLAMIDLPLFLACLLLFLLGFLMVGSLMTGTGALGTNARESQQFAAIWSILTIVPPLASWMIILDAPNGKVARALGWFPLTAPITMMMRLATGKVPLWDLGVAILCLALGVYLSVRVAAGLLRLGLLMYGKRPSLREIIRQLRHA